MIGAEVILFFDFVSDLIFSNDYDEMIIVHKYMSNNNNNNKKKIRSASGSKDAPSTP